ncbi:NADH:ubiquinone reductase (Na(+)-transporting) subunit A [Chlamydiifrater volucris]|uniref:NADH:ubiquinone reductase (Na(+)-transporting) subunit A n=1 Tax=Chlamydiifrater volucris TaxID=2681470 RepID=UPI001BCCFAE3|nr:NADH:ubiquinone reductase (Na(+)-transporting) subunit A [Chlamydiifrater volucris]
MKKGLDLSLGGAPNPSKKISKFKSQLVAVDLESCFPIPLRVLVKEGDEVFGGSPVAEYKQHAEVKIVSQHRGTVVRIVRGEKRRPRFIVISVSKDDTSRNEDKVPPLEDLSKDSLREIFESKGLFSLLRQRPFDIPALPSTKPRDIFINLADDKPFFPPLKKQLEIFYPREDGLKAFALAVEALFKLFGVRPKIIERERFILPFTDINNADFYEVSGPYPSGSPSIHIQEVAPIKNEKDTVITLGFYEALSIGNYLLNGSLLNSRIISLAGSGLKECFRSYLEVYNGFNISQLLPEDSMESPCSVISGDPLNGRLCYDENDSFLNQNHHVVSVLPKPKSRESFSFLRLGARKFTITRTYLYSFLRQARPTPDTNLHGEPRPFIDSDIYDKVMPMKVPVVPLMKAIITNNYDLAIQLGFLEISSEDFSLPTLIDPSKNEMVKIVRDKLNEYVIANGLLCEEPH